MITHLPHSQQLQGVDCSRPKEALPVYLYLSVYLFECNALISLRFVTLVNRGSLKSITASQNASGRNNMAIEDETIARININGDAHKHRERRE